MVYKLFITWPCKGIEKSCDRKVMLPFFFRYKHLTCLKNVPFPPPIESLSYWFQGNFAAAFVLNYWLREFLLSAFTNRFELRCEPKRLMLLYYKICPCCNAYLAWTMSGTNWQYIIGFPLSRQASTSLNAVYLGGLSPLPPWRNVMLDLLTQNGQNRVRHYIVNPCI